MEDSFNLYVQTYVGSLFFKILKVKRYGLDKIIEIYHKISNNTEEYLVLFDINKNEEPIINYSFLLKIFLYASENEDMWMKNEIQRETDRSLTGSLDQRIIESEKNMSMYEKRSSMY